MTETRIRGGWLPLKTIENPIPSPSWENGKAGHAPSAEGRARKGTKSTRTVGYGGDEGVTRRPCGTEVGRVHESDRPGSTIDGQNGLLMAEGWCGRTEIINTGGWSEGGDGSGGSFMAEGWAGRTDLGFGRGGSVKN